jgi:hypothetical protein
VAALSGPNWWVLVAAFFGNAVGCVLAMFCLGRITDTRRTARNRWLLVVVGAWALVETARDDALFVAATSATGSTQIRFLLLPSLALTAFAVVVGVAVLRVVAARPTTWSKVIGGGVLGLLVAGMTIEAIGTGRADLNLADEIGPIALVGTGICLVTALSVWLVVGATRRPPVATAIMVLAVSLTLAQYWLVRELLGGPAAGAGGAGVLSVSVILFTALAFTIRMTVLSMLSVTDTSRYRQPLQRAAAEEAA